MSKIFKWLVIGFAGTVIFIIALLLIAPYFIDVQKYKPVIEQKVSAATGRPVSLKGDLELSLFPWAGLSFSDLQVGNPDGFEQPDFVSIQSFDVRVKFLPLLSRQIEVKRFVLESPRIVLIKNRSGKGNWEGLTQPSQPAAPSKPAQTDADKRDSAAADLPIKTLQVDEFAIRNGEVVWIDRSSQARKEVKDISLTLENLSLDQPIGLDFSGRLDGQPFSLKGTVGPVGRRPGHGTLPLELEARAFGEVQAHLKGDLTDAATSPRYALNLNMAPFSPRDLLKAIGADLPMKPSAENALTRFSLSAGIQGDTRQVAISDGRLALDASQLTFSLHAKEFSKPDVQFALVLDGIDVDDYLPPASKTTDGSQKKPSPPSSQQPKREPVNYAPLRSLVLDGTVKAGKIKAGGAQVQNVDLKVTARDGRIRVDPLTMDLYQGSVNLTAGLDVRQEKPQSSVNLQARKIQVGPLLKDTGQKDLLEGTFAADAEISMRGDEPVEVKKSLQGNGDLTFENGAIKGIDLAAMIRNIESAFGQQTPGEGSGRTEFTELKVPFTIQQGVVKTEKTHLTSPVLEVRATGQADLVQEKLDMRVEPRYEGQSRQKDGTSKTYEIRVPVLISGTFNSPTFRPDLEEMVGRKARETVEKGLQDILSGKKKKDSAGKDAKDESIESQAKGLLKGLLGE